MVRLEIGKQPAAICTSPRQVLRSKADLIQPFAQALWGAVHRPETVTGSQNCGQHGRYAFVARVIVSQTWQRLATILGKVWSGMAPRLMFNLSPR